MRGLIRGVSVILVGAITAAVACAGPEFTEPPSDAGNRKTSATDATGIIASGTISGELSGAGMFLGTPDFEDMYIIQIRQPGRWQVSTSPVVGRRRGFAEFDSVLWLFRYSDERGVLANDEAFSGAADHGARFRNFSTDGTGISISAPGTYLLVVSVKGRRPVDQAGTAIFEFGSPTEVSGPDGSTLPLNNWVGTPVSMVPGAYRIDIAVPPCPGDVDGDAQVGLNDIAAIISSWGQTVQQGVGGDLNADGLIGLGDIAQVLTHWAEPCL